MRIVGGGGLGRPHSDELLQRDDAGDEVATPAADALGQPGGRKTGLVRKISTWPASGSSSPHQTVEVVETC